MNRYHHDIYERIADAPLWFDEDAMPRYCAFTPDEVANIYAHEVALVDIACQGCGHRFLVAFSWNDIEFAHGAAVKHERFTPETVTRLHYGDPPNVGCCPAGPTMNCEDLRVVEFWRKGGEEFTAPSEHIAGARVCLPGYFDWRRVPELEVLLPDHPACRPTRTEDPPRE